MNERNDDVNKNIIEPEKLGMLEENSLNQPNMDITDLQDCSDTDSVGSVTNNYVYNNTIVKPEQEVSTGLGVASLVLGILSILFPCCGIGILCAIVGVVLGCVQKKDTRGKKPGTAIAGIVISSVVIAIYVMYIVCVFLLGMGSVALNGWE